MLSVEILADAVLTCGRTARLVSSQTNFNVDVYSAVTADFLKLPSRWDAWQMLFALMGERRGRFPHRRTSTLYSAFMEEFLKLFYWWISRLVLFVFMGERRGLLISSQTNLILYSNQGKGQVGA